jgi:serine/threonine protein kinase
VKVADFGIARLQGDVALTQAGNAMGSPLYMSPEQVEGIALTGSSDVYSLASSLFRMAAGHPPVEAEHIHGILWRIASQDAPELRVAAPNIPKGFSDLVKRMHSRNVKHRPTMKEAAHEMRQWLASQGVLDPAEHLRRALGFPQASALAPAKSTDHAVLPGVRKGSATAMIADALDWFRQKFAKAS